MCSALLCFLHRYIIDHSERNAELYTCQEDEWTSITFTDYSVPLQDTANSWVLVFRLENIVTKRLSLSVKENCQPGLENLGESRCKRCPLLTKYHNIVYAYVTNISVTLHFGISTTNYLTIWSNLGI